MRRQAWLAAPGIALLVRDVHAIDLDVNSTSSVVSAAKTIASNIMDLYNGNSTIPGLFPDPYYFWESGLAWDSLVNYWAVTGDDAYNSVVSQALAFQVGPKNDYMPPNQTKSEGQDDQSFWALACMTAAERGFPVPPGQTVTWLQLAQNVFDEQALQWQAQAKPDTCGGGLRWQVYSFNNGYSYTNSQSNGNFLALAARLSRFTGNQTFGDWASKVVQWSEDIGLVANVNGSSISVYDGTSISANCSQINHIQWTATLASYLSGSSFLVNSTSNKSGASLTSGLIGNVNAVFVKSPNNPVLYEVACDPQNTCNTDQLAFRAVLGRALADTLALTNDASIHDRISRIVQASAMGAAAQCSGGDNGTTCGNDWTSTHYDGSSGLGQSLSALNIILANLPAKALANSNSTATTSSAANGTSSGGGASLNSSTNGINGTIHSNGAHGLATTSTLATTCILLTGMVLLL